jgi:hypothetical protein
MLFCPTIIFNRRIPIAVANSCTGAVMLHAFGALWFNCGVRLSITTL